MRKLSRALVDVLESRRLLAASASLVEIPISAAAISADPALANYRSFDLRIHLTDGDRFNVAGFDANLSSGDFYRLDGGSVSPNTNIWPVAPQTEFGSFVCIANFQAAPTVLTYEDNLPVITATRFHPVWGTLNNPAPAPADYTIGRLTIRNNSIGTIQGEVRTNDLGDAPAYFVASLPLTPALVGIARGETKTSNGAPLPNVRVYHDADDDGVFDAGEPSTMSANTGEYRLIVSAGSVKLRAISTVGFPTPISPSGGVHNLNVAGNGVLTNVNFVFAPAGFGSISGKITQDDSITTGTIAPLVGATVYVDVDGDSTLDAGEPSKLTDSDGQYTLTGVPVGTYRVRRIVPANLSQKGGASDPAVTLINGQNVAGLNFAYFRNDISAIRGRVQNVSGGGLASWRVYLDANGNTSFDNGEETRLTDSGGNFSFVVAPGDHVLRQVLQTGFEVVSPVPNVFNINVSGGAASTDRNFVNRLIPLPGSISGFVRQPANHVPAGGSVGLSGVTVYLDLANNGVLDAADPRTVTAANGSFQFLNQTARTYTMRVVIPSGYRRASTSPDNQTFTLGAGQQLTERNFVLTQRIMLAGVVFDDKNFNGVKDAGEKGFGGRRIFVDLNNDGLITTGEPFIWPGSTGTFSFEDLVAGTYTVRAEQITNWFNVGTGAITTTLASGGVRINMQFGQRKIMMPPPPPPPPPAARVASVVADEKFLPLMNADERGFIGDGLAATM